MSVMKFQLNLLSFAHKDSSAKHLNGKNRTNRTVWCMWHVSVFIYLF